MSCNKLLIVKYVYILAKAKSLSVYVAKSALASIVDAVRNEAFADRLDVKTNVDEASMVQYESTVEHERRLVHYFVDLLIVELLYDTTTTTTKFTHINISNQSHIASHR